MNTQSALETLLQDENGCAMVPLATGSFVVPAELANLDKVMDPIHEELESRGCPFSALCQLDIAIEELFVNICNYAYVDQDGPGPCWVDYAFAAPPNTMVVQLKDQGIPFDPLLRKDPTRPSSIQETKIGGLGIFMTKKSVDDIVYQHGDSFNIIAFKKCW